MKKLIGILAALALLGLCACAVAESRTAVVYFSCTGTTQGIAEWIAEETGGELMQILPAVPYTEEDLAYYTDCRADLEQADDSARPEIANLPESMAQYDTVFLGWPIWHGKAPKIIYTFLEGVDLTGSTIIPFCTSASSPMGSSAELLQPLTAAWWRDGRRFGQSAEKEDVAEWVAGLGLNRKISITVGGETRLATLANSPSAEAFYALLPLTVSMEDYGGFEKVGPLGTKIVQCDERITTAPGDIILYQGDQVTIYYAENTWNFTRLGHLDNDADAHAFLGDGDPTVTFDAAPDATPEEPEPTTATVGGLKYSLKGGNATATGPKSQNAKKLTIPATIVAGGKTYRVTAIKASSFKGMKKLASVVIGKNVKSIGKNAFSGCKKLKTITIKTTKLTTKTVGANAFKGVYKKATVKVPAKKLKAYRTLLVKKGLPKTAKVKK